MGARRINVSSGRPLEAKAHYSRALRVGNVVYQSGTTAIDREGAVIGVGDLAAQVDAIMAIARESMGAADGRFEDVVRARIYVTDPALLDTAGRTFAGTFADVRPALTLVPISRLVRPAQLVEIELEAVDGAARDARRVGGDAASGSAAALRIDDRVLVSGLTGSGASIDEEVETALATLRKSLGDTGAAWEDLVRLKCFVAEMDRVNDVTRALETALSGVRPVGSLLGIPSLSGARGRLVIEGEAVVGAAANRDERGRAAMGPFAQSVAVGDRFYVSALAPVDSAGALCAPDDWAGQNDRCVEHLGAALANHSATLGDVVARHIFTHADAEMNRAYGEGPPVFAASRPVALGCRVPALPHAGQLVSVEGYAIRGAGREIEWRTLPT